MDSFYSCVPVVRKTRLHFHEFMREVHRQLEELRGRPDPLDELAKRIARKYRLICFDEFHVSDVADAMMLHRLLDQMFANGVQFVMTSNYRPDLLYPDGLHRERVLPAIDLLQEKLDVLNVDAGIDYRKRALEQVEAYHTPLSREASAALRDAFVAIAGTADESPILHIEHRELTALPQGERGGLVRLRHACGGPRSQNDYLELASEFHTVILSDVPKMTPRMSSEARRFTWLIDVFYDHKVKLLMSARCPPTSCIPKGRWLASFTRTGVADHRNAVAGVPGVRATDDGYLADLSGSGSCCRTGTNPTYLICIKAYVCVLPTIRGY